MRYWVKTWLLVNDNEHDTIPTVTDLQKRIDCEGSDDHILACKILEVAVIKPPDEVL